MCLCLCAVCSHVSSVRRSRCAGLCSGCAFGQCLCIYFLIYIYTHIHIILYARIRIGYNKLKDTGDTDIYGG